MGGIKDSLANIRQVKRRHNRQKLNFYQTRRHFVLVSLSREVSSMNKLGIVSL